MQPDHVEYPINSGFIQVVVEGHVLPAFWAHPDTGGTFPGVVVIHSHWGLTAFVRRVVRRYAERGHYVIAPDLFDRAQPETLSVAHQRADSLGDSGPPYVAAAISALRTHNHCNGDIAIIGYDMGGKLALHMAAHRDDLKAVVVVNGAFADYRVLLPAATPPILGLYGSRAGFPVEELTALKTQLKAASEENDLIVYEGVGQDFFDDTREAYVEATDVDALTRTIAFLADHLIGPSEPPGIRQKHY